jgi:hypothetical protein
LSYSVKMHSKTIYMVLKVLMYTYTVDPTRGAFNIIRTPRKAILIKRGHTIGLMVESQYGRRSPVGKGLIVLHALGCRFSSRVPRVEIPDDYGLPLFVSHLANLQPNTGFRNQRKQKSTKQNTYKTVIFAVRGSHHSGPLNIVDVKKLKRKNMTFDLPCQ